MTASRFNEVLSVATRTIAEMRVPTAARFVLALLVLPRSSSLPAFARDWHIARFDTHMYVAPDGADHRQRAPRRRSSVGEYHGIYRDIPIEYPARTAPTTRCSSRSPASPMASGHKLKYDSSTQNGNRHLKIYIPDAVDTTRTVDHHLQGDQRGALVRRSRRTLLERDRQRLAGAHRQRRGDRSSFRRMPPATCARRPSPARTDRRRRTPPPRSAATWCGSKPTIRSPCATD